jgi:hypothetical protein
MGEFTPVVTPTSTVSAGGFNPADVTFATEMIPQHR